MNNTDTEKQPQASLQILDSILRINTGKQIKIYLTSGVCLAGILTKFDNECIYIENSDKNTFQVVMRGATASITLAGKYHTRPLSDRRSHEEEESAATVN